MDTAYSSKQQRKFFLVVVRVCAELEQWKIETNVAMCVGAVVDAVDAVAEYCL